MKMNVEEVLDQLRDPNVLLVSQLGTKMNTLLRCADAQQRRDLYNIVCGKIRSIDAMDIGGLAKANGALNKWNKVKTTLEEDMSLNGKNQGTISL